MPTFYTSTNNAHNPGTDLIAPLGSTLYYLATCDSSCSLREALTESGFRFTPLSTPPYLTNDNTFAELVHYEEQVVLTEEGGYYCPNKAAESAMWCYLYLR